MPYWCLAALNGRKSFFLFFFLSSFVFRTRRATPDEGCVWRFTNSPIISVLQRSVLIGPQRQRALCLGNYYSCFDSASIPGAFVCLLLLHLTTWQPRQQSAGNDLTKIVKVFSTQRCLYIVFMLCVLFCNEQGKSSVQRATSGCDGVFQHLPARNNQHVLSSIRDFFIVSRIASIHTTTCRCFPTRTDT